MSFELEFERALEGAILNMFPHSACAKPGAHIVSIDLDTDSSGCDTCGYGGYNIVVYYTDKDNVHRSEYFKSNFGDFVRAVVEASNGNS